MWYAKLALVILIEVAFVGSLLWIFWGKTHQAAENPEMDDLETWLVERIAIWKSSASNTPLNTVLQRTYDLQIGTLDLVLAQVKAIRKTKSG